MCVRVMHGRRRMTVGPSQPYAQLPGRSTSGFDRSDRQLLTQVLGDSVERTSCILQRTACEDKTVGVGVSYRFLFVTVHNYHK